MAKVHTTHIRPDSAMPLSSKVHRAMHRAGSFEKLSIAEKYAGVSELGI